MKSKKQLKAAVILLFVCMCGVFYLRVHKQADSSVEFLTEMESMPVVEEEYEEESRERSEEETKATETTPQELIVHVCGAVGREGVYHLPVSARVVDALEAAGGLASDAAGYSLNQAEPLEDGMQIYVPTRQEWEEGRETPESEPSDDRIDLNRAGKSELMTLPGIGESKAEAILSYREECGGFKNIEELMKVPGIKEGTFDKIKQLIVVSGMLW